MIDHGVTTNKGAKARIERAAVRLFASLGVDGVTTKMIARDAAVSEGAIYRHYESKEALAQAIFFTIHRRLAQAITEIDEREDGIAQITKAIVSAYCAQADSDWDLFVFHLLNTHRFLPRRPEDRIEAETNPVELVEAIIERELSAGELSGDDARLKAAMALGVVLQAALHKVYGRITGKLGDRERALTRAALAALRA